MGQAGLIVLQAMHYHLKPATNDDRIAIERLVFAALAEHGLQPDPGGTDADLQDIQASYLAGGGMFDLLVDEAGQVVGSVGLCRVSESACELRKMYLAPAARGSGWGRRLLEHALARAAELGFRRVVLETASVLRAAIALYERYGFQRYEPSHLATRCDAAYYFDLQSERSDPTARSGKLASASEAVPISSLASLSAPRTESAEHDSHG